MFWGKNMSNNEVFSIIVCTFAQPDLQSGCIEYEHLQCDNPGCIEYEHLQCDNAYS
jgi:hypothetical protein